MHEVITGDCLTTLQTLDAQSVHCCVTSPPYYGLRDYGHDDQIGLEETPDAYVAKLVAVFREVRRVLRDDGTLWLNLGDSYGGAAGNNRSGFNNPKDKGGVAIHGENGRDKGGRSKDLIGIPWRVAFALQADGWYLRQDIIWHKPNPMPESVTDRCTKAHEYIFLLSKSARYFYDAEAVKDQADTPPHNSGYINGDVYAVGPMNRGGHSQREDPERVWAPSGTRNKRSVWTVATQPFPGAHFAVFPPKLIEPCVLAGCPARCCPKCGKGWDRVTETTKVFGGAKWKPNEGNRAALGDVSETSVFRTGLQTINNTIGHRPGCDCGETNIIPGVVLDPFTGAGTTGVVCANHGRDFIGCELNPEYADMARERITIAAAQMLLPLEDSPCIRS